MKQILFFCLLGIIIPVFGQENEVNLEKAFKKKDMKMYNDFLAKWQSESVPIASMDSLSEVDKDIYEIFADFYNPFNLERVGSGEWGDVLYSEIEYAIIQNSIYAITFNIDSLNFSSWDRNDSLIISTDSIIGFRPNVLFDEAKVLFLTPKYETLINEFLGDSHYALGTGGIMNPARAKGNSAERVSFLNKKLLIIYGHWGGYWHIETHPYVFNIDFNKDRTVAKVHFRLVYQGGEANYYKLNGKWIFKDAYLTWIE